jgi:hypothetical protein
LIRGYGNSVHKTTSTPGKFSFTIGGSIAPPAGGHTEWNPDQAGAPGGDISL